MKGNLLVDIGNTRLKWALDTSSGLIPSEKYLSSAIQPDELVNQHWAQIQATHVLITCVGNQQVLEQLSASIFNKWGLDAGVLVSPAMGNGITNAYAQPEKLGSDRWAAMVAAMAESKDAVCVVDCGTAVTLDVVSASGLHQGGLIAPGLGLSRQCLQAGTQINFSEQETEQNLGYLGQSTEQCIQLGTKDAICGMINMTYQQSIERHGAVRLILTGGDAALLQPCLEYEALIIPDLVLRGLAEIQRSRLAEFSS